MAARLARYTGNTTYSDWAEKTWDWMWSVNFIDHETYAVYDGAHVETNCTDIFKAEFTYNNAVLAQGAAYLYNMTTGAKQQMWQQRLEALTKHALETFIVNGAVTEIACETANSCTADMDTYKGFFHRWYATVMQLAPKLDLGIMPMLQKSAQTAITQCTGGAKGRQCGLKWSTGKYDGSTGAGQEMSALAAVMSLIGPQAKAPLTSGTGGTSKGNPNAGATNDNLQPTWKKITAGDKVGAGILTVLAVGGGIGLFGWISMGDVL